MGGIRLIIVLTNAVNLAVVSSFFEYIPAGIVSLIVERLAP